MSCHYRGGAICVSQYSYELSCLRLYTPGIVGHGIQVLGEVEDQTKYGSKTPNDAGQKWTSFSLAQTGGAHAASLWSKA